MLLFHYIRIEQKINRLQKIKNNATVAASHIIKTYEMSANAGHGVCCQFNFLLDQHL